jgi:hypothetical protein
MMVSKSRKDLVTIQTKQLVPQYDKWLTYERDYEESTGKKVLGRKYNEM